MATRIKRVEIRAGDFLRVHDFPVRNYHKGPRGGKFRPSSEAQKKYNQKMRELHLRDLLHCNFTDRDFALRLSYDGESPDIETALACIRRFLRRLKRAYRRAGVELKYIYCTERGKHHGRVHHHLVVNSCPTLTDNPYFFKKLWNNGGLPGKCSYVYAAPLEFATGEDGDYEDGGLTGLSKYIIYDKQKETDKQYSRSRNLAEPEVTETVGAVTRRELERVAETGDLTDLLERYPDYFVYKTQVDRFDEDDADIGAPPLCGTFVTVFLCRKKMKFNITSGGMRFRK